jgi:hypothetical protein
MKTSSSALDVVASENLWGLWGEFKGITGDSSGKPCSDVGLRMVCHVSVGLERDLHVVVSVGLVSVD